MTPVRITNSAALNSKNIVNIVFSMMVLSLLIITRSNIGNIKFLCIVPGVQLHSNLQAQLECMNMK